MSIIWIFADQRSGSTAFCEKAAQQLGRIYFNVNNIEPEEINKIIEMPDPEKYLFYTHTFSHLEKLGGYSDHLFLIRCTRKNKEEQCLSFLITNHINQKLPEDQEVWNIKVTDSIDSQLKTYENAEPIIFTKKQVFTYLNRRSSKEQYWNSLAHKYDNITLYYEDMCNSDVEIPSLNLSLNIREGAIIKLPPYKERLCLNHEMVRKWVKEYYDAQVVELVDTQR